jgi:3-oxoacyl-[acyl-carrier-protein] synthase-3
MLPRLYFSRPATVVPKTAVDNETVLSRIRGTFRGADPDWQPVEQAIRYVFERCNTKVRYLEADDTLSPGAFAAQAAQACLDENGVRAADLDLLIYGGIARDAFEPATAAEVAGRLGARPLRALDVTCACAGLIEAIHVAAGYFALHDDIRTALICAGEITRDRVGYDMQSVQDVALGVAGLTIGNAAAALLITREPLPNGGARLVGVMHKSLPENWALCRAPVDGHFTSDAKELFALSIHVLPELLRLIEDTGWAPEDVDHYAFHQPSQSALERVFAELGAKPEAGVHTHALYGNTASTAWALALDHRLRSGAVAPGDKIVIGSAAAGFTVVGATAVWEG